MANRERLIVGLVVLGGLMLSGCGPSSHVREQFGVAVRKGEADKIESLLENEPRLARGGVCNAEGWTNTDRWTALHIASSRGYEEVVEILTANGAKVDARTRSDYTPLHLAAQKGHKGIVEILLDNGAKVNAKNDWGWTPLHEAVSNSRRDVTELLIIKGADVNAASTESAPGWTPLFGAALCGNRDIAELLIANGAKVNLRCPDGRTPLNVAATDGGNKDVVELLIANGAAADVDARDKLGCTPLHNAAKKGYEEIAELLIANGADVNARDVYFDRYVLRRDFKGGKQMEWQQMILEKAGFTPLHWAIKNGHEDVAALLRKHGAVE